VDAVALLQVASTMLLNAGFTWLVGSWFARRWMRSAAMGRAGAERALGRLDVAAAGLAIAAGAAALWAATAAMGGTGLPDALPMVWMMIRSTDHGHASCVAMLAMAMVLVTRARAGSGKAGEAVALLALLVFAVTRAQMGHAGEEGWWTPVLLSEVVHLLAIGLWTGAVLVSGWFVLREGLAVPFPMAATSRYLALMSQAAMVAVAAIGVTGVYNAWHRVGTAEHLLHTGYGWILLAKVALVILAIALGGYNKFVGLPAAAASRAALGRVRTVLQAETFLLLGALLAAAILTSLQPPTAT
jgi:copper resistance protein D